MVVQVGVRYRKCDTLAIFCAGAGATPMMSILKDVYFRYVESAFFFLV